MTEKKEDAKVIEQEINGCRVRLIFSSEPVDGLIGRIKEILTCDYEERT